MTLLCSPPRALCIALALSLTVPTIATAEPAASEPTAPAPDDALAEAKARHVEAKAKYETADYQGAIVAWQQAFAALPGTTEANPYRSIILYNIAAARERLFQLRGDVEHLKQAKILLEQFIASIEETYPDEPEEAAKVRAEAEGKLAHIDDLIAAAERDAASTTPPVEPAAKVEPTPAEPPRRDPAKGMVIGGSVSIGIGVLAAAGMTAALVVGNGANDLGGIDVDDFGAREDQFDRGRAANAGAIAAGVIGAAALATGIALVVVGTKRRASTTAFAPMLGRGLAGLGFAGRF